MLQIPLDDLDEESLRRLLGTPETYVVEFKRELDLSSSGKRLEVAKDVAALANSQGGRLFYGISEKKLGDGQRVADALVPLADASLQTRLEDVICGVILPRPRCRLRRIDVADGFILVVEVYPSIGRDLHMTQDYRFYRRGETRTVKMSEPEVREAYGRLALSSLALEKALESTVAEQLQQAPQYGQSVLIVPWYARRDLADPRSLAGIGKDLAEGPFRNYRRQISSNYLDALTNLQPYGEGLRSNDRNISDMSHFRLSITRFGVVNLADSRVIRVGSGEEPILFSLAVVHNMLAALDAASLVLGRCAYWGPVHVVSVLKIPPVDTMVVLLGNAVHPRRLTVPRTDLAVPEVNLVERGADLEPVVRDLADQLFQHLGDLRCPWFSDDGHLIGVAKAQLPSA